MATLYGHGKGKAGSHSPGKQKPYWTKMKLEEVAKIILELHNKGYAPAKIGLILRDSYGISNVKALTGKKISKILEEKGLKLEKQDLHDLLEREKKLKKHLEKNKKDTRAKRGFQLTKAKVKRLRDYYSRKE